MRATWIAIVSSACGAYSARDPGPAPPNPCATKRLVHVVDPAGTPIAGAQVHAVTSYMQCGPSGLPEGCSNAHVESDIIHTNASGTALVCVADVWDMRRRHAAFVVEYRDWPVAQVDAGDTQIVIGPPRSAIAEFPTAGCSDLSHVHVTAQSEHAGAMVWAKPVPGVPVQRFRLDGLGPWTYWVRSHDDRSGNSALEAASCAAYVRLLEPSARSVILDSSDAAIDLPAFAGARARITAFRSDVELSGTTLDDAGRATIALPEATTTGTTFCLRLDSADHSQCAITFARAGEVAVPGLYAGREHEIAATCGTCP